MTDLAARILSIAGIRESEAELRLEDYGADALIGWAGPQLEAVVGPVAVPSLLALIREGLQ